MRVRDILGPIARPLILAPLCFAAAFWVERATGGLPAILQLALGVAAGVVPIVACLAIPAYRRDLAQIVGFVKQVRKPATARVHGDEEAAGTPATSTGGPTAASGIGDVEEVIRDDAKFIRDDPESIRDDAKFIREREADA